MKIESEFTTAEVQTTERQSENGGQIINCLLTTQNLLEVRDRVQRSSTALEEITTA